jgi:hypothetical protein
LLGNYRTAEQQCHAAARRGSRNAGSLVAKDGLAARARVASLKFDAASLVAKDGLAAGLNGRGNRNGLGSDQSQREGNR